MATPAGTRRLTSHPILPVRERASVPFTFDGRDLLALEGEVITSALFAAGIRVFGHHPRDGAPQGIFCVNGQCSQCTVLVDDIPVKGCMTVVRPGMKVRSCEGHPVLPPRDDLPPFGEIETIETEVLVIGGGPAGINAALELGALGIETLLVDDKQELGGKLTLQTHPFFGSRDDCYAGIRGIEIARILTGKLAGTPSVRVVTGATAVGAFHDRMVGMYGEGGYFLVEPRAVVVACGAREKGLAFPGCDLPGVYGAGAFQTLLNRDLVVPTDRLFIVGGGNVGLIAGYHAIQAGIRVVGLVEALPRCGGYKVHADKLHRLGVPIHTSHTVLRAQGDGRLERITIAAVDEALRPVEGTERSFDVDTLLIAVGLTPIDELAAKLSRFHVRTFTCGDSAEIAEASAAIFSGRITGRTVARELGYEVEIPPDWGRTQEILRSRPGAVVEWRDPEPPGEVFPVIRCVEEIPCNPCVDSCPNRSIAIPGDSIMGLPVFSGECSGCLKCVAACPALAITIVRRGHDPQRGLSLVVVPYELDPAGLREGLAVATVDMNGEAVGEGTVVRVRKAPGDPKRMLVSLEVPDAEAVKVAGLRALEAEEGAWGGGAADALSDETIICRCERVTAGEVRAEIRAGVTDMNTLKATIRTGMGACGGKTCTELILRLYREEGIDPSAVTRPTDRPFVAEVPLSAFAGIGKKGEGR
ncbi:MAG: FAD-dependent oxidoreductase [Candidatus Krumholzibacteria bacterium]|nr:FAD-dependent oxidoreductase [Candidatus Krumholzibacteria bacterium]